MTNTTLVQQMIRERRVCVPAVVRRPNITPVMTQAMVGYIAGNFLLILARILLVDNEEFRYYLID